MNAIYTLKHLKYFIAVAEHKHFGMAAEACYVTQPTLSAAIKELEEILGVTLLERTKRSVLITPIGEEILEQAKAITLQADALAEFAQSRQEPLCGDLRMGVIPTIGPFLLPEMMGKLREAFPKLKLFLREDQTARLLEKLKDGQLDVLVLALPYESDNVETFSFADDYFMAAVPNGHRLTKKKVIKNEDIFEENLLLLEEGHCLREHAMAACSWSQAPKTEDFSATSLSTIVQMVANNLGITLLPEMAVRSGITRGTDIQTIKLDKASPPRQIGLVWRKTSGRKEEFKTLGQFLKDNL